MEVVEHVDPPRLERAGTGRLRRARPGAVIVTTPNAEYNVSYDGLAGMRHPDHRFEWTRAEFARLGRRRGEDVRLPRRASRRRRCRPRGGPAHPDGGVRRRKATRRGRRRQRSGSPCPRCGWSCSSESRGAASRRSPRRHFAPTQVISWDFCRGLVADDENDQAATPDAFDVLDYIVGTRLRRGPAHRGRRDQRPGGARALAGRAGQAATTCCVDAIVLDVPEQVCHRAQPARPDRDFGPHVIPRSSATCGGRCDGLRRRASAASTSCAAPTRSRPSRSSGSSRWNDRTGRSAGRSTSSATSTDAAPSWRTLLDRSATTLRSPADARSARPTPRAGTAVFVGDLVDRGPDTPGVLRLVMGMVAAGTALCVSGNHENKLVRALNGPQGQVAHGLAESLDQLAAEPRGVPRRRAGLHGRADQPLRARRRQARRRARRAEGGATTAAPPAGCASFALYGDTTGETDEYGLPVRYPWAAEYRGRAMVVYGHTPVPEPEWVNNTICLDTGCVFGGQLTALRYPEREIVTVPAEQDVVRAGPAARSPAAGLTQREPIGAHHRRRDGHAHGWRSDMRRPGQDPRGERCRRAGDHEPVRRRPALADLPAADDVARRRPRARAGCWSTPTRRSTSTPRGVSPRWCARRSTWARGRLWSSAVKKTRPRPGSASATARRASSTPAPGGRSSLTPTELGRPAARRLRAPLLRGARHRLAGPRLRAAALVGQGAST